MLKDVKIKLEATRIHSLNFRIKDKSTEDNVKVPINIEYNHLYDYKKKCINISIRLSIGDDQLPFLLEIIYEGVFFLNKRVPRKDAEQYAKINCPAILFPFLRECVADITRRAGFNPLILPSINFIELAKQQK